MIRVAIVAALCLNCACCLQTTSAGEPDEPNNVGRQVDDLADLPGGWRWDRPVSGHAQRQGDAIRLRTEAARIWAGEGNENRIITEQPLGETASAFAEIELVDAVGKWEQCGLLVYQHDDSFVKLVSSEHYSTVMHYV